MTPGWIQQCSKELGVFDKPCRKDAIIICQDTERTARSGESATGNSGHARHDAVHTQTHNTIGPAVAGSAPDGILRLDAELWHPDNRDVARSPIMVR